MKARTPLISDLGELLRELVRVEVDARLRELGVGAAAEYSTISLPPGVTRRVFIEACRGGLVQNACKDGRSWTCTRDAWHRARGRKVAPPRPALRLVPSVDNYLASIGRGGRS